MNTHVAGLVELADIDELIREIDRICARRDWQDLVDLRTMCRRALDTGRQLWGVAGHAEYRLALEAPPEFAAVVAGADPGPFAPGPLAEVLARSHGWAVLEPHLGSGPFRNLTAYECVAKGEDLSDVADAAQMQDEFELPLRLCDWEPQYSAVTYRPEGGEFHRPKVEFQLADIDDAGELVSPEPSVMRAIKSLLSGWTGTLGLASCNGSPVVAIRALEEDPTDICETTLADAMALMAWAGAHGRRRSGSAAGRAKAWWALAALVGEPDCEPSDFDELVADAGDCRWWIWGGSRTDENEIRVAFSDDSAQLSYAFVISEAH